MLNRRHLLFSLIALPTTLSWVVEPAMAQAATVQTAPADGQTSSIVAAANAFLVKLSDAQKAAVQFKFTDADQRARWSNFPLGIFERAGVRWGDLDQSQRDALWALLGIILSPRGLTMVREQMAADDVLASQGNGGLPNGPPPGNSAGGPPPNGGPGNGGPGPLTFGSDYYWVSFLGTPSASEPWMLQFGGHHLALNATVAGNNVTLAPSLTGGQPVKFTLDGKAIYIVADEVEAATALLNSFTAEQKSKAVVSTASIDLVLGPGKDGLTLQPEGLAGSAMTPAQKELLVALIEARLGILNADDLAPKMDRIKADIEQTYFAWFGPVENPGASYWRAPTIVMEFSPQSLGGDKSNHLHSMYRDPTNDYGAAWTA